MILQIIFWTSLILLFHTYVFYPAILAIFSLRHKGNMLIYDEDDHLPFISVVISAYNEESHIGEKIRSIYHGSYPSEKFEVLVGSDASDDDTVRIAQSLMTEFPSLKVVGFKERRGKGNVVNDLVHMAKGNILVLTDANVIFHPETLYHLVKHFKNPAIGLVDTNMINSGMKEEGISFQEKAYISREVRIKNREGKLWGAMMGPFGGCYSILKEDYVKVPANFLVDDFYVNMKIFEKGKLAINDINAMVFEDLPDKLGVEFRRKVRIGTGDFQNLREFWRLLFTARYGFAFLSHKVLRWLGPFFLLFALISNIFLAQQHEVYLYLLILQAAVYILPLLDFLLSKTGINIHPLRLITHFFSMNAALFVGFFKSLKPVSTGVWERTSRG